jgi:hypothetical protein
LSKGAGDVERKERRGEGKGDDDRIVEGDGM